MKIKVLIISDWVETIIYSENIRERFSDIDFIISCGDLPFNYLDFIVTNLNKPLFFVFGNHVKCKINADGKAIPPPGFINIHKKIMKINNLWIAGHHGSLWYNGGPYQYRQFQVFMNCLVLGIKIFIRKLFQKKEIDIFISHAPPYKYNDRNDLCHRGFKAFILFHKIFKPKYHVHGHIHIIHNNEKRKIIYKDTEIINCSGYYVLEVEK